MSLRLTSLNVSCVLKFLFCVFHRLSEVSYVVSLTHKFPNCVIKKSQLQRPGGGFSTKSKYNLGRRVIFKQNMPVASFAKIQESFPYKGAKRKYLVSCHFPLVLEMWAQAVTTTITGSLLSERPSVGMGTLKAVLRYLEVRVVTGRGLSPSNDYTKLAQRLDLSDVSVSCAPLQADRKLLSNSPFTKE